MNADNNFTFVIFFQNVSVSRVTEILSYAATLRMHNLEVVFKLLTIINITNKMTIHIHKFNMTVHLCSTDFVLQLLCLMRVNITSVYPDVLTENKIFLMQTITSFFPLNAAFHQIPKGFYALFCISFSSKLLLS